MTKPTAPNYVDPILLYKSGEEPVQVHLVDAPAWEKQGWTREVPPDEAPPEEQSKHVKTTVITTPAEVVQPLEPLEPSENEDPPTTVSARKKPQ